VAKLPTAISGSELRRALERVGFAMTHILNEAGLTVEQLLRLL
jgi:hypothetical protein